jgi:hypothetical protein
MAPSNGAPIPRNKPTRGEVADRVRFMRTLLEKFTAWHLTKAAFKRQYGVGARNCERYRKKARDEMIAESKRPVEEHRAEALMLPYQVRADTDASNADRLRANMQIVDVLGLAIRKVGVEHSGSVDLNHNVLDIAQLKQELLADDDLCTRLEAAAVDSDASSLRPPCDPAPPPAVDPGAAPGSDLPRSPNDDPGSPDGSSAADPGH